MLLMILCEVQQHLDDLLRCGWQSLSSVKAINFAFYNKIRILSYQPRSEAAPDLSIDTYL